jgi:hypothetical protein
MHGAVIMLLDGHSIFVTDRTSGSFGPYNTVCPAINMPVIAVNSQGEKVPWAGFIVSPHGELHVKTVSSLRKETNYETQYKKSHKRSYPGN